MKIQSLLFLSLLLFLNNIILAQQNLNKELLISVKKNNLPEIKSLIKRGADISYKDSNNASLLMWAAKSGSLETFTWLYNSHPETKSKGVIYTDTSGSYYGSVGAILAGEGKMEILQFYIKRNPQFLNEKEYDPESGGNNGWTPLHWASYKGHLSIVEYLLNQGAKVNISSSDHKTALHYATLNGHKKITKLLISHNADPNLKDNNGWTALHFAARDNYIDIAARLLYANAQINIQNKLGWTPLMLSGYNNNYHLTWLLLRHGADTSIRNNNNQTTRVLVSDTAKKDILWLLNQFDTTKYFTGIMPFDENKLTGKDLHSVYLQNSDFRLDKPKSKFLVVLPDGHNRPIKKLLVNPSGTRLLSTAWDGTAKYWDINTGMLLKTLGGHTDNITDAGFSQNGKLIFTCSVDNPNRFWNAETAQPVGIFYEQGIVNSSDGIVFLKDGKRFITTSVGLYGFVIYDLKSLLPIDFLPVSEKGSIIDFVVQSDERYIIGYSSYDSTISRVDMYGLQPDSVIYHVSFFSATSTPGNYILANKHTLSIVDQKLNSLHSLVNAKNNKLRHFRLSPDQKLLLSVGEDSTLSIHELISKKIILSREKIENAAFITSTLIMLNSNNGPELLDIKNNSRAIIHLGRSDIKSISNITTVPGKSELLFSGSVNGEERIFKMIAGSKIELLEFNGKSTTIADVMFDDKNHSIGLIGNDKRQFKFNLINGKLESKKVDSSNLRTQYIEGLQGKYDNITYNFDSTRILALRFISKRNSISGDSFHLKIFHGITKGFINEIRGSTLFWGKLRKRLIVAEPDQDGRLLLYAYETSTGLKKFRFDRSSEISVKASLSDDENLILIWGDGRSTELWDISKGKLLYNFGEMPYVVFNSLFIKNQKKILSETVGTVKIWDIESKVLEKNISIGYNTLFSAFEEKRDEILATYNNEIKLIDSKTGILKFSTYIFTNEEFIVFLPSYYYKASTGATKNLYYTTPDLKIIPFNQLDIKYNRPDKILEAIGCTDTSLIHSYRQAYLKRIKKLGIDTSAFKEGFTIPEADFTNREQLAFEQSVRTIRVHINGKSTVNLDRFNIWVNEVPVYGQKGISLRKRLINKLDTTISITLSAGENQIETSVTDVNGIESYRQPLYVKYNPEKPVKSNTYFIGIGINRFADSRNNLSWSVKDIRDLSQYFASKGAIIDTLFDERVTRANILNLKQRLAGTTEEDKVIIAYSGHGLLSNDFDYYLSTHTVNFSKPEENGLPYEELESLLDGIRARKKLMLIDACHSGEVDKEEIARYETATDSLQIKGTRGGKPRLTAGSSLGMKNSFELMQELFVNVSRSTGATVISAAGGTQFAQERGDLKNGVFSFVLLELLRKNKTVNISDLKNTVLKMVPELTNGLQKPTFRSETQRFDWSL